MSESSPTRPVRPSDRHHSASLLISMGSMGSVNSPPYRFFAPLSKAMFRSTPSPSVSTSSKSRELAIDKSELWSEICHVRTKPFRSRRGMYFEGSISTDGVSVSVYLNNPDAAQYGNRGGGKKSIKVMEAEVKATYVDKKLPACRTVANLVVIDPNKRYILFCHDRTESVFRQGAREDEGRDRYQPSRIATADAQDHESPRLCTVRARPRCRHGRGTPASTTRRRSQPSSATCDTNLAKILSWSWGTGAMRDIQSSSRPLPKPRVGAPSSSATASLSFSSMSTRLPPYATHQGRRRSTTLKTLESTRGEDRGGSWLAGLHQPWLSQASLDYAVLEPRRLEHMQHVDNCGVDARWDWPPPSI